MNKPIQRPKVGRVVNARNSGLIEGEHYVIERLPKADLAKSGIDGNLPWATFEIDSEIYGPIGLSLIWHSVVRTDHGMHKMSEPDFSLDELEDAQEMMHELQGR